MQQCSTPSSSSASQLPPSASLPALSQPQNQRPRFTCLPAPQEALPIYAVSPEAAWELTGDSCLPWLTTISNVDVSADLLVIAILDRIKAKKKIAEAEDEEQFDSSDSSQDDKDWEDNDTDEDIIHVK
ncbi:hypothetical protein SLEP1_g33736 [Rubroshorea leprosula]|uniref:Uncharacterized protein n=1 Tax=Rubroshorea leprosula TaxID=152421 RepID=A0AAV5KHT1_9ROSI|nr:hypothetical protein SLEP1_g33736 [Rubroshorea leprosula]